MNALEFRQEYQESGGLGGLTANKFAAKRGGGAMIGAQNVSQTRAARWGWTIARLGRNIFLSVLSLWGLSKVQL